MAGAETHAHPTAPTPKSIPTLAASVALVALVGLLFVAARWLGWTLGWLYVGIVVATFLVNLASLLRWNPELIRRRARYGKGTKRWDVVWMLFFTPVSIAVFVVAARETLATGPSTPGVAWLLGMAIYVPGWALAIWSMAVNPFFEKTVRIQTEHGHHVIDTGPYALIRHPGYVGFGGWILSTPLLLASPSAWLPVLLALACLGVRTVLEDRTLRAELPGYAEYATRVRFRLIPGIW